MLRFAILFVLLVATFPAKSVAQVPVVQAVQQPVVRQFGVGTSVSVPDRGRAFLGGVNKAASGRKSLGPFRSGTSGGFELSNASQSASVYIFDFDEMDRVLNESAANKDLSSRTAKTRMNPRAEMAWQSLQNRQRKSR